MNSLATRLTSQLSRLVPMGKRVDDPLNDLKSAARWLDSLPVGDAFKCQDAVARTLKRSNEEADGFTRARLEIFMLLDERSRDLQDTLVRQYLRNPRMSRQMESQLWHAIYGLSWELARGYHSFVLHLSRDPGRRHEDVIPRITLRAVRAFGQLLKCRSMRYLAVGEKLWLRLHNLYRIAESGGFHRNTQRAYPDERFDCSCETAYLHILMLDLANSGTLYPRQINMLDRWLCNWHGMLQLETHLDPDGHTFVVDLAADEGPRRLRKPDLAKPLRVWGTERLLQRLNEIFGDLLRGGAPRHAGLGDARTAESLELLDYLRQQWAPLAKREQRRAPRESVKRLVDVAHGLSAVVNQIKLSNAPARVSPYGTGLDYNEADDVHVYGFVTDRTRERASIMKTRAAPPPDIERWVVHDESECGFGARVESRDKDWLRVGVLIGIRPHDRDDWQLGIVRRLARQGDETSSVGIEILPGTPELTMLLDLSTPAYSVSGFDEGAGMLPHACLRLNTAPPSLILDPVLFAPGKMLEVHGSAERTHLVLANPIDRSEGWMRVAIEPLD